MHRQPRSSSTGRFVKHTSKKHSKKKATSRHRKRAKGALARILGL